MAQIVGAFNMSHSPYCYRDPETWNQGRARRPVREDVPFDDVDECKRKMGRIEDAYDTLRQKLAETKPDVMVVFGDDVFDFSAFPQFAVYVGAEFAGFIPDYDPETHRNTGNQQMQPLKGHPELGTSVLNGLMKRGFDPAFCLSMQDPERGMGHSIMHPAASLTDYALPILPVNINVLFGPQPTAMRCYEFGKAVRGAIEDHPEDLRVAVCGSGGLWHTPGNKEAWLNEDFDREMLRCLEAGDARAMAEYFDGYNTAGDVSQVVGHMGRGSGLPSYGGPQGGTRETCAWIAAAGVVDGTRSTIVDYVPVYSSPVGAGFAYATEITS